MAATEAVGSAAHPAALQPQETPAATPPTQPLWRLALTGLGPIGAMLIFALLVELSHRLR
jgi:hypothetical protein